MSQPDDQSQSEKGFNGQVVYSTTALAAALKSEPSAESDAEFVLRSMRRERIEKKLASTLHGGVTVLTASSIQKLRLTANESLEFNRIVAEPGFGKTQGIEVTFGSQNVSIE
jgi:hypothetical protein